MRTIDLSGKTALIMGVANKRSLAWMIAEALGGVGCRMAFTHHGERLEKNVRTLAEQFPGSPVYPCDVTSETDLDNLFDKLKGDFGTLDYLIHSVAFARKQELEGKFSETNLEGWRIALEISAYSLIDITNRAIKMMDDGGSIVAMTYMASQKVVPKYNVMGSAKAALEHAVRQLAYELGPRAIRVNAISAGPVSTLSARGIPGFSKMAEHHRALAPLGRNVTGPEVGNTALFLCSDLSTGITGEIIHVDGGFNIMAY